MELCHAGKLIVLAGFAIVIFDSLIMLAGRLPFIGQLPGDFEFRRGNTTFYFPLATMIIASIILTVLLNLWLRR
jgi:hypothetical protein